MCIQVNKHHERSKCCDVVICLNDTLKAIDDFQNTIHWDKIQMLKELHLDKINGTKNVLFFLSSAPTHHSFIWAEAQGSSL